MFTLPLHTMAQTELVDTSDCAIDLMMVFDGSGSIAGEDFQRMQDFVRQMISSLPISDTATQIGVVQFSSNAQLEQALSSDGSTIIQTTAQMQQLRGDTNIVAGMEIAYEDLLNGRDSVDKIMIVLTDGEHTEAGDPITVSRTLENSGVEVLAIAVGISDLDEVADIAGSDQDLYFIDNITGLEQILDVLLRDVCSVPPGPTQIAFASDRDGDMDIYLTDPEGSDPVLLTDNTAHDNAPAFSPDGTRIAFESDVDGDFEIFVMDLDGGNLVQLTNNEFPDFGPAWSPDGSLIAFHATPENETDIFVMDADGTNIRQVTDTNGLDRSVTWAPDGQRVIYQSDRSGGREIYLTNINTGATARVTSNPFYDGLPDLSPNGSQIVFGSSREDMDEEIWVMRIDGDNPVRLTVRLGLDDDPVWSPDGSQIIFECLTNGNYDIYTMNADGTNLQPLITGPSTDWSADWWWKPVNSSQE